MPPSPSLSEELARTFDTLSQIICVAAVDGSMVYRNRAWRDQLLDTGTLQDTLRSWLHPADAQDVMDRWASTLQPFDVDCRIRYAAGDYRWFLLRAQPFPDRANITSGWICFFTDIHDRKLRELGLAQNLKTRSDMLGASVDCIKVITPDGVLSHMNRAGCRALGVAEDSAFGMDWLELLPEDVRAPGREALARAKRGSSARFPGCSQLEGASPQYWDNILTPLRGDADETTAILCVSREVTAQQEVEERLRLAIQATNDAIWDWDLRRDRMSWNEALERCYGYDTEQVDPSPRWWFDRIHPDDRARVESTLRRVIAGSRCDYVLEYRFVRADGRFVEVRDRGTLSRDRQGLAIRAVGAMLDQTDRKAIERNLQTLNQALETSVSERTAELNRLWITSPDLLVVIGFDGIIRRVNPALKEILGYEAEDFIGHHIRDFVMPVDSALADDVLVAASERPLQTVEVRHRHRDGSCRWIAWVSAPTHAEIYATGGHITASKQAEAALRKTEEALHQAQKLEAVGQLTGSVAHDFNNFLTVIGGSVELLRRPNVDEQRRKRYIDAIAETTERAVKLTSQLLAFGRRSSLIPVTFDVGANIRALREMIVTLVGPSIKLEIVEAEAGCCVHADSNQFDTAIVNIAVNARDAMNRQGHLTITVGTASEIQPHGAMPAAMGRFVTVSIADTGTGIPEDKIDSIFEPFFTTKPPGKGTGLGLSQVFGFTRQSGGDITVESRIGEGTTFTLYLPQVGTSAADRRAASPVVSSLMPGTMRVLLVEDDRAVGEHACDVLIELGHFPLLTANAEEALSILTNKAGSFDAVVTDAMLPGMSGIELGNEVRRLYPNLPVLLVSGYSDVLARQGPRGFNLLRKPYAADELSQALASLMTGPRRPP
ncbi:MAG TPA: PAS domain S-box protein [Rhodopila sp.]|uniref:hybrid sensor histidine kinase/response regulator n=1 Tax=Rhodopila sp. TaxID=2480087 RepID=UPI002BA92BE0|nr:PAS domain S-box protein [Rhodopila sp.]HVY14292.1 PAS domain S-box protein [Rhodopila sp.]